MRFSVPRPVVVSSVTILMVTPEVFAIEHNIFGRCRQDKKIIPYTTEAFSFRITVLFCVACLIAYCPEINYLSSLLKTSEITINIVRLRTTGRGALNLITGPGGTIYIFRGVHRERGRP